MENKQTFKLIFGDQKSIEYKKRCEEEEEKINAQIVECEEETEEIYFYSWECPHCGNCEDHWPEDEMPIKNLYRCAGCKKWLKLKQ